MNLVGNVIKYCEVRIMKRNLVRRKLEYTAPIWIPRQQKIQQKLIEQVQSNAARFVNNKPYNSEKLDRVTSMMQNLKWNQNILNRRNSEV